ncbi:heterokaryon incompatibility protein-domain-containing protein, partial [Phaeosphaeria sp. MPI-PUGE-AT-0046c]
MEKPLEAAVVLDDLSTIYVQHPVDRTNTTRVLELIPPPLSEGSCVISCRLQSISLDSPPAYRAVSYMWGDPSVTQLILVNGKPVMIRSNLWNFLSQMCEEGCYDALWIDALCINHQDIIERSQQVGLMGQIYSKASIVHIWLGPENDLNLVSMQILGVTDWSASDEFLAPILEFLNQDYWSRMWIIQEVVLA